MDYTRPPFDQADASFSGAPQYTRPTFDAADASFVDNSVTVNQGTIAAALTVPQFTLTAQARERITTGNGLWAKFSPTRAPETTANASGLIGASITVAATPPAPVLPFFAILRERAYPATIDAPLAPPTFPLQPDGTGNMVEQASAVVTLSVLPPYAEIPPLTVTAAGYQEIDLPERVESAGVMTGDILKSYTGTAAAQGAKVAAGIAAAQQPMQPLPTGSGITDQHGDKLAGGYGVPVGEMIRFTHKTQTGQTTALPTATGCTAPQAEAIRFRNRQRQNQQHGTKTTCMVGAPFAEAIRRRNPRSVSHQHGLLKVKRQDLDTQEAIRTQHRAHQPWQHGTHPLPGYWWPWMQCVYLGTSWALRDPYQRPPINAAHATWEGADQYCRDNRWLPVIAPPVTEPEPEPIIIPIRRVYFVIPDIQVKRLADNYAINAKQIEITLDADSHTWSCRGTLIGSDAIDAIQPGIDGIPITLAVHINGYDWHMMVMDWEENRSFGQRSVSITARGLTAELAEPWQLKQSGVTGSQMTVQQALAALLPFGSGWTITWETGTPDWIVPAGAWSWNQQTPISAIHEAAAGVGLMVTPAAAARTINISPRYKVAPWGFNDATPDIVIPESAIVSYRRQQPVPTQANGVIVHGGNIGGILGQVKRIGSAGDRLAQTASHPLITHDDAARLLATRRLAAEHQQPMWSSLTMPLGGDYPLAMIGKLLHIDAGTQSDRGIVGGLSIVASVDNNKTTVRQTVTIGERTGNTWARFRNLLPGEPTQLGEVVESDPVTGTAIVDVVGGGNIRVRGSGGIGDQVYVKGGVIQGAAPQLPVSLIEV